MVFPKKVEIVYTTFVLLLLPSLILGETTIQSPPSTPRRSCTIATDLQTAINSAPSSLQDVIIEFPSRLEEVLGKPGVKTATNANNRTTEICRLLKYHTDVDHRLHLAEISRLKLTRSEVNSFWITNAISLTNASKGNIESLVNVKSSKSCVIRKAITSSINCNSVNNTATAVLGGPSINGMHASVHSYPTPPGVKRIGAPIAWHSGVYGQGITVAVIDSGLYADHESLKGKFSGDWKDAVDNSPHPIDPNGHGTAVASVIVGKDIGVAPEAKLIACRSANAAGRWEERHVLLCAQWIMKDVFPRPQIVCNSWGAEVGGLPFMNKAILNWDSVGIHHVFAIGNSGPACGTARSPGDQQVAFSVGSVDENDKPDPASSRGPNPVQHNLKPDIAAPGVNILMAGINDPYDYVRKSGTSYAAPHAAGAMALLLSLYRRQTPFHPPTTEQLREVLIRNARRNPFGLTQDDRNCFNPGTGNAFPNAAMGHGMLSISGISFK